MCQRRVRRPSVGLKAASLLCPALPYPHNTLHRSTILQTNRSLHDAYMRPGSFINGKTMANKRFNGNKFPSNWQRAGNLKSDFIFTHKQYVLTMLLWGSTFIVAPKMNILSSFCTVCGSKTLNFFTQKEEKKKKIKLFSLKMDTKAT